MNCNKCGNSNIEGKKFCPQCGTPVIPPQAAQKPMGDAKQEQKTIFCRECGTQNDDNSYKCVKCSAILHERQKGTAGQNQSAVRKDPPNYLIPSILFTIFCCLPLGIPAIIFAAQVNSKLAAGDYDGAVSASRKAKLFMIIGAILTFFFIILCLSSTDFRKGFSDGLSGDNSDNNQAPYAIR